MASAEFLHAPVPPPEWSVPKGTTVKVHAINCTATIQVPVGDLMGPVVKDHTYFIAPCFAFLLEHGDRKVLFDLGCRKDWQNLAPAVQNTISKPGWIIDVKKGLVEILEDGGIDVASGAIESMIWSHWHYDHIGDPSTFPSSTVLVTGKGVHEAFGPGYPAVPDSPLKETDFAGRELKEIDFDASDLKIGNYRAHDFFGDGSFYLLDAPGHALANMCALARVTNGDGSKGSRDTFVLMGGDVAHHGAEFRPTKYLPLPKEISPSPIPINYPGVCPGHIFADIHPKKLGDEPYYQLHKGKSYDDEKAEESMETLEEYDAEDDVFVVIAHDATLFREEVDMHWFPNGTINDWKEKDLARKARWLFLKDLAGALEPKSGGA